MSLKMAFPSIAEQCIDVKYQDYLLAHPTLHLAPSVAASRVLNTQAVALN
jgi:hypothetical protein